MTRSISPHAPHPVLRHCALAFGLLVATAAMAQEPGKEPGKPPATEFIPLVSYQGFSFVRPGDVSALVHSHTDRCRVFLRNGQFFDVNESCTSVYNKVEPRRPAP
jgi:hypothetical protein